MIKDYFVVCHGLVLSMNYWYHFSAFSREITQQQQQYKPDHSK